MAKSIGLDVTTRTTTVRRWRDSPIPQRRSRVFVQNSGTNEREVAIASQSRLKLTQIQ